QELRLLAVGADLEHHELIGVEGYDALSPRKADTYEIDTRLFAGLEELALRPVAHDLHARLAFDDHRRGEVPVAPGEVVIDIGPELGHAVELLLHRVGAERFGIEIDGSLLVEIGSAG